MNLLDMFDFVLDGLSRQTDFLCPMVIDNGLPPSICPSSFQANKGMFG